MYSHSPFSFVPGCNLSFDGAVGAGLPVGPAVHDIRLADHRHQPPCHSGRPPPAWPCPTVPLSHCPIHLHPFVLQPSVSCILTTFSALQDLSNHPLELGLEAGDVLHQARLPGHQPRVPLLVLDELLAQPLGLVRQVPAVAVVLLHQLVPLPRQARHLGCGLLQLELVSECCSFSLSC